MKHYLNICDIDGAKVDPVDVITFGSPCQDLSVAGKRAGLKHFDKGDDETPRSGLFIEAVRIIREMREATNGEYPKFALWENVPGALSSNDGEDFRTVLEELAKIIDKTVSIPRPEKGKWTTAGRLDLDGGGLAWRILDAQYTGVPQRRRRILLVADFTGQRAGEILFKCEGLPGYPSESGETRKEASTNVKGSFRADDSSCTNLTNCAGFCTEHSAQARGVGFEEEKLPTLRAGVVPAVEYNEPIALDREASNAGYEFNRAPGIREDGIAQTLKATGHGSVCYEEAVTVDLYDQTVTGNKCMTLRSKTSDDEHILCVIEGNGSRPSHKGDGYKESETMYTLNTTEQHAVAYGTCSYDSNSMKSDNPDSGIYEADTSRTLDLNGGNPACNQGGIAIVEPVDRAYSLKIRGGVDIDSNGRSAGKGALIQTGKSGTLGCSQDQYLFQPACYDSRGNGDGSVVPTITGDPENRVTDYTAVAVAPINRDGTQTAGTLTANNAGGSQRMPDKDNFNCVLEPVARETFLCTSEDNKTMPLKTRDYKAPSIVAYGLDRASFNQGQNAQYDFSVLPEQQPTLTAKGPGATCSRYIIRRLTPTECARLQGFPDDWGRLQPKTDMTDEEVEFWREVFITHQMVVNGKLREEVQHRVDIKQKILNWYNKLWTDGAEYKMWGNGVALPCIRVPIHNMAKHGVKTMASLFDGSGGFPLAGILDGIEPIWCSEIEPYPIAVTMERFPE